MSTTNQRILGYDFARGLAIIGMVLVNFKMVIAQKSDAFLYQILDLLSGKAAALFVVLAGVGITLMHQSALGKNRPSSLRKVKHRLLKRAIFLFVVGLSYYPIWPADILHYYGLYLTIGVFFVSASNKCLQISSLLLIFSYPIALLFFSYETGWNWDTLTYTDFFTLDGFFRNLFFNGFHPVFPWVAFLLIGIWIGRFPLHQVHLRKRVAKMALFIFLITQSLSLLLINTLTQWFPNNAIEISHLLGTTPMPSFCFYMISAASLAVFIIAISIGICQKSPHIPFVKQLISTGQLGLSNYFFHVLVGMFALELFFGKLEQAFSIQFMLLYALLYCTLMVILSHLWRQKYTYGPVEHLMRKITG